VNLKDINGKVEKGNYYVSFTHTEKLRSRKITLTEIEEAISQGQIIEDYPHDTRGPSCLVLGFTRKFKPLHIVCANVGKEIIIITAYEPASDEWTKDLKTRRK